MVHVGDYYTNKRNVQSRKTVHYFKFPHVHTIYSTSVFTARHWEGYAANN